MNAPLRDYLLTGECFFERTPSGRLVHIEHHRVDFRNPWEAIKSFDDGCKGPAMNFNAFCDDVLGRAHGACLIAGSTPPKGYDDPAKTKQLLACCAIVVRDRGLQWCRDNPRRFRDEVLKHLGLLARLGIGLASLFGGPSVWLMLAGWIIPAVLDWITAQMVANATAWGIGEDVLGDQAQRFLDELRHAP